MSFLQRICMNAAPEHAPAAGAVNPDNGPAPIARMSEPGAVKGDTGLNTSPSSGLDSKKGIGAEIATSSPTPPILRKPKEEEETLQRQHHTSAAPSPSSIRRTGTEEGKNDPKEEADENIDAARKINRSRMTATPVKSAIARTELETVPGEENDDGPDVQRKNGAGMSDTLEEETDQAPVARKALSSSMASQNSGQSFEQNTRHNAETGMQPTPYDTPASSIPTALSQQNETQWGRNDPENINAHSSALDRHVAPGQTEQMPNQGSNGFETLANALKNDIADDTIPGTTDSIPLATPVHDGSTADHAGMQVSDTISSANNQTPTILIDRIDVYVADDSTTPVNEPPARTGSLNFDALYLRGL